LLVRIIFQSIYESILRRSLAVMYALLVLKENGRGLQVVVKVRSRMKERIIALLEDNQGREAFELLKTRAEVEDYVPQGMRPRVTPVVTLVEDML
jgi:hypothetical protein